jgi:hypothetical protein
MGGAFEKQRLVISSDERGIFDFGLASKGLFRKIEYYSGKLKDESPEEFPNWGLSYNSPSGVVDPNLVFKDRFDQFWYTSVKNGKKYLMERRQEGSTAMMIMNPKARWLEDPNGILYTDPIKFDDFSLGFATTNKKSYLIYKRDGGKARMVDLYVGIGGLVETTYESMLARAMHLLLAARYFEMAGIRTRISATRMYDGDGGMVAYTFPIKKYGEDLNFDWIAMNVADPRFFRWNLWKYVKAMLQENEGIKSARGWGTTIYYGLDMSQTSARYKNWYFQEAEAGRQPPLKVDRNLMLFGGLKKPSGSIEEQSEEIIEEFFRIIDIVDIQYNKTDKVADRIYKRMVEEKGQSVPIFKKYVQKILREAYEYPEKGQYATEQSRQNEMEKVFDAKIDALNKYLEYKSTISL